MSSSVSKRSDARMAIRHLDGEEINVINYHLTYVIIHVLVVLQAVVYPAAMGCMVASNQLGGWLR